MKLVIAGSNHQFLDHMQALGFKAEKDFLNEGYKYCNSADSIRGLHDVEVVFVGTYWETPAYRDLVDSGLLVNGRII